MIDIRPVLYIAAWFVLVLAAAMLVPLLVSLHLHDGEAGHFTVSFFLSAFLGGLFLLAMRHDNPGLNRRQAFLLIIVTWIIGSFVAALPLYFSSFVETITDAVFESVSGLTTTGSTILTNLDSKPASLLLWRSMTQWLGGIGIIVMGLVILPFLKIGGMELFRIESSDTYDKVVPKSASFISAFAMVYVVLTAACAVLYGMTGMSVFEAVNHAMTTLSTGGYSTSDASMGHFTNPATEWVSVVFMTCGGIPFVLFIRFMQGKYRVFFTDEQVRFYIAFLVITSFAMAFYIYEINDVGFLDALRLSAFHISSVMTTTGYASTDYLMWGAGAICFFFFLTFMGGCAGSTAGGFKVYRLIVMVRMFIARTEQMITPHKVIRKSYNGQPINDETEAAIISFTIIFVMTVFALVCALTFIGLDFITAFSGAATAVANVGPGIGPIIGPAGNFSSLPDVAKWLLIFGMLLGRLELMAVAVVLLPGFWRG
ncbi:MAG: potassium transporter TrkH [Alphaproteobacteria bacterium]|nr:potassium transporter TrkH [Alphaproteobacteria bacterium]